MKKRITKDFETRSRCDLKKMGAFKYSMDPSTQPTCLAYKPYGGDVRFLDFKLINTHWTKLPSWARSDWSYFIANRYEFSAFNSFFERCIYDNILVPRFGWPSIPPMLRRCIAAKGSACALPRALEKVGAALRLHTQKDFRGHNAMMRICKPTREWKLWNEKYREDAAWAEPKIFIEYDDEPETWDTMYDYCKIDVKSEEELDRVLPDLPPDEQEIWHHNQKLNWRGLRVDVPTCQKIVGIMAIEDKKKRKELDSLTMGLITKPGARDSILEFLALEGVTLPNLQAKTIDDKLAGFDLSCDMRELLEIRKACSKMSTRKYQTMLDRAMPDHRVRDLTMYHGASTGRDTGTGIQPHNFFKRVISQRSVEFILELLKDAP